MWGYGALRIVPGCWAGCESDGIFLSHTGAASEEFSDGWNYPYMHIGKFLDPPMQSFHLHIRWLLVVAIPIKFPSLFNIQSCCFVLSPPNITEEPCLWGFTITVSHMSGMLMARGHKGVKYLPVFAPSIPKESELIGDQHCLIAGVVRAQKLKQVAYEMCLLNTGISSGWEDDCSRDCIFICALKLVLFHRGGSCKPS